MLHYQPQDSSSPKAELKKLPDHIISMLASFYRRVLGPTHHMQQKTRWEVTTGPSHCRADLASTSRITKFTNYHEFWPKQRFLASLQIICEGGNGGGCWSYSSWATHAICPAMVYIHLDAWLPNTNTEDSGNNETSQKSTFVDDHHLVKNKDVPYLV